ncbi:MAG: hypothetical protein JO152_07070 [Mycobacteriaceae bacterium]|nr:hypothetical protein [Mycobacteriaceae bacterium]
MATNPSFTGFHPWNNAGSTSTQYRRYRTASNNGTAIFMGDCLKRTAAGVWGIATAGAGVAGVCGGASYWDATINGRRENTYLPASTTYSGTAFDDYGNTDNSFLYVTADPVNTRFQCQYSASTPALTDMTKNASFAAGSGGSTTTGISSHVLDQTTIATTAALDFTIVDIKRNVLNDPAGAAATAKAIVQINVGTVPPFNSAGTAGV